MHFLAFVKEIYTEITNVDNFRQVHSIIILQQLTINVDFEIFKKGTLSEAVIKVVNDEAEGYVKVLQVELGGKYIALIEHIEKDTRYQKACQG